ncbi:MAG: hypothetical protein HQL22_04785 [Candidatus Omnitrophica bacterium]|nr:hypothetical protein [Candidatus Omnitrophota bacterium]
MNVLTFKGIALLIVTFVSLIPAISFAQATEHQTPQELRTVDIRELTQGQNFRYGRELYRKGDFTEAAKVFQHILKSDCTNRPAQYHLQKIAQKGPEFNYLRTYLSSLPCQQYDFSDEDFLPATFYYTNDNDLMLEQLVAYNRRYKNSKITLSAKIAEYAATAARLEAQIKEMTDELNADKELSAKNKAASAKTIADLQSKLAFAQKEARAMDDQVSELKKALAQATIEKNRTAVYKKTGLDAQDQNIEIHKDTTIASLKEELADVKTRGPAAPGEAKTKSSIAAHEPVTAEEKLSDLQAKFARIQERLRQIEASVAEKNKRIEALQENLGAIQK